MTIGFIGCGKMGGALATRVARADSVAKVMVSASNITSAKAFVSMHEKDPYGAKLCPANNYDMAMADIVFLAVKPDKVEEVLQGIGFDRCHNAYMLVSMVAGLSLKTMREEKYCTETVGLCRIMPNLAVGIGQGVTALCRETSVSDKDMSVLSALLAPTGRVEIMDEKLFNAITAISGSGPAYAFVFIEALADAAVRAGIKRDMAYTIAADTLKGAAAMVLDSGMPPAVLKDAVCSPGGTTIEAIAALEKGGFRSAIMEAVQAAYNKCRSI